MVAGCQDSLVRKYGFSTLALVLASGSLVIGCGETETETADGCFDGVASFKSSLRQAPGPVLLGGTTSISDCLPKDQSAADLVDFGEIATQVATETGAAISEGGPDGIKAAIDAGYLVGAVEKGAEDSQGIHAVLVERVRSAASNGLSRASESVQGHYEAGYQAGRDVG
jgi:hypothetical protein